MAGVVMVMVVVLGVVAVAAVVAPDGVAVAISRGAGLDIRAPPT